MVECCPLDKQQSLICIVAYVSIIFEISQDKFFGRKKHTM